MKKGVIFLIVFGLFLIPFISAPDQPSPSILCSDSDGGKDPAVRGVISIDGEVKTTAQGAVTDSCSDAIGVNGPKLVEWFCDNSHELGYTFVEYECVDKCENGICIGGIVEYDCIQKGTTCCLGDSCTGIAIDCITGKESVFGGCSTECSPIWSCVGETKICTSEAKLCADGTSVAREGPNCEFPACPTESGEGDQGGTAVAESDSRGEGGVPGILVETIEEDSKIGGPGGIIGHFSQIEPFMNCFISL